MYGSLLSAHQALAARTLLGSVYRYLGCSVPQQGERGVAVGRKDDGVKVLALAVAPADHRGLLGAAWSGAGHWTA